MTRPAHEYEAALALVKAGLNDREIARRLEIPQQTVNRWRHGRRMRRCGSSSCPVCEGSFLDAPAYCYLLGLYLGDGYIVQMKSCQRLSLFLDASYPEIVKEATRAVSVILPGTNRVGLAERDGCIEVVGHWKHWRCVFPQHRKGAKHERSIKLWNWQRDLTSANPDMLLRGLIHSDGCRFVNRVWGPGRRKQYAYPRYQFSNRSADIRAIFCEACDDLGISWKQSNQWTISVSQRMSIQAMDRFVGPKK